MQTVHRRTTTALGVLALAAAALTGCSGDARPVPAPGHRSPGAPSDQNLTATFSLVPEHLVMAPGWPWVNLNVTVTNHGGGEARDVSAVLSVAGCPCVKGGGAPRGELQTLPDGETAWHTVRHAAETGHGTGATPDQIPRFTLAPGGIKVISYRLRFTARQPAAVDDGTGALHFTLRTPGSPSATAPAAALSVDVHAR
ncbi:hypothetical protein [Streptantibioticus cattleyicolor]|uniref:Lipoprotein n=1 Tax=Streptantibioticus cattleyicolor (strain ATCC 35852 / DSM 46488 / JCM 4925 / NBRC 14057 / NRRL 8057) TaxID=1003195 RepID=F8JJA6_STREN|nr:hypothetical protein [Streptantibioticus cattleyicolor]AEW98784.1 hypothetical protein SCATT_p05910 [Streptantibioticus cattleyicolor NRRL 8057 = DSM 46488]CCB72165.1 exported protein of unknown function [Streptantibioticus cattleyicolor NRRL 8057 = DSM 46488]